MTIQLQHPCLLSFKMTNFHEFYLLYYQSQKTITYNLQMNQIKIQSRQDYPQDLKELPEFFQGISLPPEKQAQQDEFEEIKQVEQVVVEPPPNLETSFVEQQNYYTEKFDIQQIILIFLFIVNLMVYFYFYSDRNTLVFCQVSISVANVLLLLRFGVKSTTLPYIYVIVATIIALIVTPFLSQVRQFMFIPLLYPLGLQGVKVKVRAIWRAIRKQSIWMFLSISLLLYIFGYISFNIFWENKKYFSSPIHASVSLLQVSTFDGIGEIISKVSAVSGMFASFSILISTVAIFQILYNINQALILQYVHQKSGASVGDIFISLLQVYGLQLSVDARIFKYTNLICTSAVFVVPFQPQLTWLYILLSSTSFLSIVLYEITKGNIFGYRSVFNAALQTAIVIVVVLKGYNICFLLCCFRILLIKQILNLWKKIKKVLMKVYPMLSLMLVFYIMFAMLIFCLQQESLENTFITGIQMLALDDWSSHVRNYAWYMKIIILSYMLIGNHILLNSLISQAFNELEDRQDDLSFQSRVSDSLLESLNDLPAQKKFVNILKQLRYENYGNFQKNYIYKKNLRDDEENCYLQYLEQMQLEKRRKEQHSESEEIEEPYFDELNKTFSERGYERKARNQPSEKIYSERNLDLIDTRQPVRKGLRRMESIRNDILNEGENEKEKKWENQDNESMRIQSANFDKDLEEQEVRSKKMERSFANKRNSKKHV